MSTFGRAIAPARARLTTQGLGWAARQSIYLTAFAIATLLAFDLATKGVEEGWLGFDLRGTLWDPAFAIRDGRSPYPAPVESEVEVGNPALYPPFLMLLIVPLTLLPWSAGVTIWIGVLGAAMIGTLFVLGVRDLRCYGVALASTPVMSGLVWGNATLLLLPLVALAWRWRERWLRSGTLVGLAIASKLFLWPLFFWLLGTRRYRAAGAAAIAAGAGVFVPWAVIGFAGLSAYPDLLRVAEDVYAVHSYSVATMLSALGIATTSATNITVALGLGVAAAAVVAGRRGSDGMSIALAVLAAVLGSPIVWEHYYALLFIPLAILRPRFSALWTLPLVFYATHALPRPRLFATELEPGGTACCKPDGVPMASWVFNHAPPGLWPALGHALLAVTIVALALVAVRRQQVSNEAPSSTS